LSASGYETLIATTDTAARAVKEFAPDLVLIELRRSSGANGSENDRLALARRLRAEPATYALPLVFVFDKDESTLRNAALNIGADDYFGLWISAAEMLSRLDALFWRIEAGRRSATVVGDQRLEIDNFMLVLDTMREGLRTGASGTLALLYAVTEQNGEQPRDKQARDRTLAEAHGFLKLNLRRMDSVAFYGPMTLLVYLPGVQREEARALLSKLRREFLSGREASEIAIGAASFPVDGSEVESLIEKAEAAALEARNSKAAERVVVFEAREKEETSSSPPTEAFASEISQTGAPESSQTDAPVAAVNEDQFSLAAGFASQLASEVKPEGALKETARAGAGKDLSRSNGTLAARAASEAAARERERRASGAIMPRRLLLTISDGARLAQINALVRSAGYEARAAFNGQQALDLLRIERPDLLLLDYELHDIDGVEMLRRLSKQHGGRLKLPVVLLLPPEHESAGALALEAGARAVVQTPYDPAELLDSLRQAGIAE
jgi:DNA-binding response OmpR family regulator